MARGLYDIARMTTATTGSGASITLGVAASGGWLTFAQAGVPNGQQVRYGIVEGNNREVGLGTYTSAGLGFSRDTVIASTNSGSRISLLGAAEVYITPTKADFSTFYSPNLAVSVDVANAGVAIVGSLTVSGSIVSTLARGG